MIVVTMQVIVVAVCRVCRTFGVLVRSKERGCACAWTRTESAGPLRIVATVVVVGRRRTMEEGETEGLKPTRDINDTTTNHGTIHLYTYTRTRTRDEQRVGQRCVNT